MRCIICLSFFSLFMLTGINAWCQQQPDSSLTIINPLEYIRATENRMAALSLEYEHKLKKKQDKLLAEEAKLHAILVKADSGFLSLLANTKLNGALQDGRSYIPLLDSLGTSLSFLSSMGKLSDIDFTATSQAIAKASASLQGFEFFHSQMQERLALMKDKLLQLGKFKELQKIQEKLFYYKQQAEEYRQLLNQPDKLISKTLGLLQRSPVFRDFFARNSQLSSMFMLPGASQLNGSALMNGLQTVSGIQSLLQQRFGLNGTALQSQVQAPSPSIEQLADMLKEKLNMKNGTDALEEMPDFKPDPMRNRTFWQRMEFGSNIQAQRANIFPATMDFAITAAYHTGERNSIGIGIAYKIGLGEVFKNIQFSHQGIGLRSFIDYRWKGNIYLSGGFEMNYRQQIHSINVLRNLSDWQRSGLIGVSRKFIAGNKLTGRVQLLWDLMSYQQVPKTQPFIFRFGYTLNK